MTGVIDVSGVIEILFQKEKVAKYRLILDQSSYIMVPDLYVSELTNTLWKYYRAKNLSKDECIQYIQDGISYIDKFIDCKEIWQEAFSEGVKNNHSIYDMFYLVTARRNNGILITNDGVLAGICKKSHVQVSY
jgi:predicted nucleic acid-binding protein